MTEPVITELINRRRDRAIAAILGVKEREADPHLPADVSKRLRKVVLDQLNDLTGLFADLVETLAIEADGVVLNEFYLAKIVEIHDVVTASGA